MELDDMTELELDALAAEIDAMPVMGGPSRPKKGKKKGNKVPVSTASKLTKLMMDNYQESDEAFARRLQAQELGNMDADAHTPLMQRGGDNPTVINARLSEVSTSRFTMYVVLGVNAPQVIAAVLVLSMHWGDAHECDRAHTLRWKWWAIFTALRMAAYTVVVIFMNVFR
ncbi:hypothetical protein B484DRAFT_394376 [Ochromonadaceae sp. CCMP2298]|nr:hypothetical protein B484DRAFT_394376 [Ochromonadaceae sp. CCMP2298]